MIWCCRYDTSDFMYDTEVTLANTAKLYNNLIYIIVNGNATRQQLWA